MNIRTLLHQIQNGQTTKVESDVQEDDPVQRFREAVEDIEEEYKQEEARHRIIKKD